ncbi:hypothetical protein [Haloplasma contractile]|uniref:Tetratricopeptide repeat protein n=1 Tax=Haloplasma contractile SSD-17B TaxID=1033810 RepID=U2E874_9MOLU|nr:hypothetical protein [Haloplasma contractile]ERJ11086.1 hypothetical protein HLPCO_002907 [Haloplasma contractile SSD-17B]
MKEIERLTKDKKAYKRFKKQMKIMSKLKKKEKYDQYITEANKVLDILKATTGFNNPTTGKIHLNIGFIFYKSDQLADAYKHFLKAEQFYEEALTEYKHEETYENVAEKLEGVLAELYNMLTDCATHFEDYETLTRVNEKIIKNPNISFYDQIGAYHQLTKHNLIHKDLHKAYEYGTKTVELLKNHNINEATYIESAIMNLANASFYIGKRHETIRLLEDLLDKYQIPETKLKRAYALLYYSYRAVGDYEKADQVEPYVD